MSENTKIEWADHSWSPWRGCTKVSPGCANCYAEALSKRNPKVLGEWGPGRPRVLAKNWSEPERWNKRHVESGGDQPSPKVFPSLCDWLDEEVSPAWLANFMALVHLTPNLNWLLLTKRPENWRERIYAAAMAATPFHQEWLVNWLKGTPPSNVWFGVSVEDQTRANQRIPQLLQIPAKVRWLSIEPLLGPVDIECVNDGSWWDAEGANKYDALRGIAYWLQHGTYDHGLGGGPKVDWLVVGGESGNGSRPCSYEWIRDIAQQAFCSQTPIFVKQVGHHYVQDGVRLSLKHPKGGDMDEWPENIRVRQFPTQP